MTLCARRRAVAISRFFTASRPCSSHAMTWSVEKNGIRSVRAAIPPSRSA
jgi:hypothetical protein